MKKLLIFIISIIIVIWAVSKVFIYTPKVTEVCDLDSIISRGKLVVATSNHATDYFIYNGEPKGFQFELLQELGNYLGLKIEIIINNDPSKNIKLLKNGDCDLIASNWSYSNTINDNKILKSFPILETELVLVQRKPADLIISKENTKDSLIRDPLKLEGKSVYVPIQSVESELIKQINNFGAINVKIYEMPQYTQEKLIGLVASGEIDYTICNSIFAKALKKQYPELDFETVVKDVEPIVWNYRNTSPGLKEKINQWITEFSGSSRYAILTDKYFNNRDTWFPAENKLNPSSSGQISAYDNIIKKYSKQIKWDWRLLASLIYQESRFKPHVRSGRGAWGLMQLMPTTQSYFGIDTTATPEMQIKAGVQYIKFLDNAFASRITDPKERINFILASYNVGPGHVFDAQKIAKKMGKDPEKWFNSVDSCLLSKAEPKHYKDPDIRFGYCKGVETFNFVTEIIGRYHHYKNILNN